MAATSDGGADMMPSRVAWDRDGCAPAVRAAFHHRTQASDPVTKRFGPTLGPTKSENGWGGTRDARSDAAGRLLTNTLTTAATAAVAHESRWERS